MSAIFNFESLLVSFFSLLSVKKARQSSPPKKIHTHTHTHTNGIAYVWWQKGERRVRVRGGKEFRVGSRA
jgi:hypothetical protein